MYYAEIHKLRSAFLNIDPSCCVSLMLLLPSYHTPNLPKLLYRFPATATTLLTTNNTLRLVLINYMEVVRVE